MWNSEADSFRRALTLRTIVANESEDGCGQSIPFSQLALKLERSTHWNLEPTQLAKIDNPSLSSDNFRCTSGQNLLPLLEILVLFSEMEESLLLLKSYLIQLVKEPCIRSCIAWSWDVFASDFEIRTTAWWTIATSLMWQHEQQTWLLQFKPIELSEYSTCQHNQTDLQYSSSQTEWEKLQSCRQFCHLKYYRIRRRSRISEKQDLEISEIWLRNHTTHYNTKILSLSFEHKTQVVLLYLKTAF